MLTMEFFFWCSLYFCVVSSMYGQVVYCPPKPSSHIFLFDLLLADRAPEPSNFLVLMWILITSPWPFIAPRCLYSLSPRSQSDSFGGLCLPNLKNEGRVPASELIFRSIWCHIPFSAILCMDAQWEEFVFDTSHRASPTFWFLTWRIRSICKYSCTTLEWARQSTTLKHKAASILPRLHI